MCRGCDGLQAKLELAYRLLLTAHLGCRPLLSASGWSVIDFDQAERVKALETKLVGV